MKYKKVEKLPVKLTILYQITSRWQKNHGFLLNGKTKISTDCFVLEVSAVDGFQNKICIVSIIIPTGQKKEHETLYITLTIWKNWSSYRWLLITQNLKKDKVIITIKHENYSIQWEFESLNMNFFRFCLEGTSERVRFLEFHQQGFVCISSFWVFKLSRVNCVYKFASFLIKLQ